MTIDTFLNSVNSKNKPNKLNLDLEALWYDGIGDWDSSHDIAQKPETAHGDRIHAYLHRKEGDQFNAEYWYRRCGVSMPKVSLEDE